MLIYRYPYGHGIILKLAVHLVHVEPVIKVLLKSEYVLLALFFLPLSHLTLQPSFLAQNLETSLTPEELRDEEIGLLGFSLERKGVQDLLIDAQKVIKGVGIETDFFKDVVGSC